MPTTLKGILNGLLIRACVHCDEPTEAEKGLKEHNELVDQALKALAELIREEKRNEAGNINWNLACEHIAQLIEGKE